MTREAAFLLKQIQLVRTGMFTAVAQDEKTLAKLKDLSRRKDQYGYQSAALIAEIKDQVGEYQQASDFANYVVGTSQLTLLADAIRLRRPHEVVRAHAWLLLQCAVSEFRRVGGHQNGIDLLTGGINRISANRGEAINSQHIESLFYFWRGRILSTASFSFLEANDDFNTALRVADNTLSEKLGQAAMQRTKKKRDERRNNQIAAGTYVLSAILGFGLAQARQLESKLVDSLWFLRAAVPLSRCGPDTHRRGFIHLLMGTVLRGLGHRGSAELDRGDEQLQLAKEAFEPDPQHRLHLARVYHQVALSHYNRIDPSPSHVEDNRKLADQALKENTTAATLNDSYKAFRDPLLEYGVKVARSLIETARGNFTVAEKHAAEAENTIAGNVPREALGWALVAKGMSLAERVKDETQEGELQAAKRCLHEVSERKDLRQTDRAAALLHLSRLYSRVGISPQAATYFHQAKSLAKGSEHGWIKDLQECAQNELKEDFGAEVRLNVEDLLKVANENKDKGWDHVYRSVEIDLKRRLLLLPRHQEMLSEIDGEGTLAKELGVTRSTVFNWKKDPALSDFFPARRSS